jgi:hypothetical protein
MHVVRLEQIQARNISKIHKDIHRTNGKAIILDLQLLR